MAFVPTKRRSDSPQGKSPVKAKFDHTTVPSIQDVQRNLDMRVPDDAMVEDTTIDDDTADAGVAKILNSNPLEFEVFDLTSRHYHSDHKRAIDELTCSRAIDELARTLLPAIFPDNQHHLTEDYKATLHRNPWLIKMLFNAYKARKYHDIRRIGLCGS